MFVNGKFYTGRKVEHQVLFGVDYCRVHVTDAIGNTWGEKKFGLFLANPQYYVNPDSLKNLQIAPPNVLGLGWTTLYLQDQIKFSGKLALTVACHISRSYVNWEDPDVPDYQRHTKYSRFTPRVGLTWLFSDVLSAYALYDQSYWPQFAKNFEHKPFQPLTGYIIETGMKGYFFKRKLGVNLSLFDVVKNNTATADPLHNEYYIQTGQIKSKGIDVDITGNITQALLVNANYEYADAKITKDSDPGNVGLKNFGTPDHCINFWVKYNLMKGLLKNVSFAMGYQYMGKRSAAWNWSPGDEIKSLPVYNLIDAAISYRTEKFSISLNVYNITNMQYATFGYFNSATNEWRYTPGEPANFRISAGFNLLHKKKVSS